MSPLAPPRLASPRLASPRLTPSHPTSSPLPLRSDVGAASPHARDTGGFVGTTTRQKCAEGVVFPMKGGGMSHYTCRGPEPERTGRGVRREERGEGRAEDGSRAGGTRREKLGCGREYEDEKEDVQEACDVLLVNECGPFEGVRVMGRRGGARVSLR
ncbi:hypothetical protein O3P69_011483 [Scylla paramamosain]|uniref:Uncharacterized protein n=1 Tax=Scylla paramamosain TaxID=85552 RepID=A0AAW0T6W3_SCYPA